MDEFYSINNRLYLVQDLPSDQMILLLKEFLFIHIFFVGVTESPILPSQNGEHSSVSPVLSKSSKKSAAPPPPPPKPAKITSVKVRQAPTINEINCYNGTNDKPSSPSQQPSAINT